MGPPIDGSSVPAGTPTVPGARAFFATLPAVRRVGLVLLVLVSCRWRETVSPATELDHRRDDYASTTGPTPPAAVAIVDALRDAPDGVRVDERLSVVADELAERSASGATFELDEIVAIAREAGSPLFPVLSVAVAAEEVVPDWGGRALAAVPGNGPLAIGLSSVERADGRVVVVFARELARLTAPVPRRGVARFEFELPGVASAFTPAVLVVAADGPQRIPVQPTDGGHWIAERTGGFDGTLVAILGTRDRESPSAYSKRGTTELLAALHFGEIPQVDTATALPDGIAQLRSRWHRAPLQIDDGEATPCGEPVAAIADQVVMLRQQCVTWKSDGDDAARLRALLVNPLALEMVADPAWQLAEIRRDPGATSIRLARPFEDVTPAQVHERLSAVLRQRWPDIQHDAKADAKTGALATKWAGTPLSAESIAAIAEESAQLAANWSSAPQWFRLTWSDQDLALAFELLAIDGTPKAFTLGTARGTGPEGEPRHYVVLLLAVAP